jgi:hypothetical protein
MPFADRIRTVRPRISCVLSLLLAAGCHTAAPPPVQTLPAPAGFDPAVTLPYLASDQLEGRGVGTHGLDVAADFLAAHIRAAGLRPLPALGGYFQPFDYAVDSSPGPECRLSVAGRALQINQDFRPLSISGEGAFSGPVVLAGYGITSPARSYDDYAHIDARGKVVLAMRFEPMDAAGRSRFAPAGTDWSDESGIDRKMATAAAHGAVALLLFTPEGLESSDALLPFGRPQPTAGPIPVIQVTAAQAKRMLKSPAALSGFVKIQRTVAHLKNIVGLLPGRGPHADEYVVVGAHYDHLGRAARPSIYSHSGAIYHGADDNASGTAAVLEMIRDLSRRPPPPRSILFILFSAEERGLIGSAYFTSHPPVDLHSVVAMLNLDMVGRVRHDTIYVGGEATAADFDAIVNRADQGSGLTIKPLPLSVGGRGGLGPSDHMPFALRRIPILFLFSGMHPDYHRPTDTADKINFAGIRHAAALGERLIGELAAMPRESYDASADVGSAWLQAILPGGPSPDHLPGTTLGVILDFNDADETGARIQDVTPGTPAAAAGLRGGDLIVRFNDKPLAARDDLAYCLMISRGGDRVKLTVRRGNQTLVLIATLIERKG